MLVIIDIQEHYIDEFRKQQKKYDRLISELAKRVRFAREQDETVINLTTFYDGYTLPEVIKLITSCKSHFFIGKDGYDGSTSIAKLCQRKGFKPNIIELAGIFQDVCVLETWMGLKSKGFPVVPVKRTLTIPTLTNWKKLKAYPEEYLTPDP